MAAIQRVGWVLKEVAGAVNLSIGGTEFPECQHAPKGIVKAGDWNGAHVSRLVLLPGYRLGMNLSAWLEISADSPGRDEYAASIREIDSAERTAAQVAHHVYVP